MDSNKEVLNRLEKHIISGEVSVYEDKHLTIECESKAFFKDGSDYSRVKTYLRKQGFESDGMGGHTRYTNSKGEVCSSKDYFNEINIRLTENYIPKTALDILTNVLLEHDGDLTFEIALIAMEKYGEAYYQNEGNRMLKGMCY